ncbi:MAG: glycosyltransferase [Fibromonadaceae bacterium]|jgi:glycosyltransferase involved in cell wall biosynthesis|nr:glycosyltransferase [Fibromonadaceae bacterium]
MNILFLLRSVSSRSGIDIVTRILANEFVSMGYNVNLCCLDFSDSSISSKIKYFKIFGNWRKIDTSQNVNILKSAIQKENINIIINQECQNIPWANLAKKAAENSNAKIISCLHFPILMTIDYFAEKARKFPVFFAKFFKKYRDLRNVNSAYDNSDVLVLLSEKFLEHYKDLQPKRNSKKIRVITNPLNLSAKEIDFEKKQKTILFVGRISEYQKRLSLIIEIWKIILSTKKYDDWNLKIVGDGEDMETIKEKTKNLDRIYFEGKQKSESYFEVSSIFIMTSAFEGFPMTLAESLKRGCVPIAMNTFLSLSDVIENEKNGFVIPDGDINAMAKKIQILMTDESLRKEMALNGLESVKKFDIKIIAQKWESLFNELSK